MSELCFDVIKEALPTKIRRGISDEVITNIVNVLSSEPDYIEVYRDNFLSYASVLNDGRFKITDYLNAVKYCSHKLLHKPNIECYKIVFPERYVAMVKRGVASKDIASIVSSYNQSKLVTLIMEQSVVPTWVLNQDKHQEAINVLVDLMHNAQSEKVRADSASSLLTHLKPPETKKFELDIGLKESKEIMALQDKIAELASQQRRMIDCGVVSAEDVAKTRLIPEVIEHE